MVYYTRLTTAIKANLFKARLIPKWYHHSKVMCVTEGKIVLDDKMIKKKCRKKFVVNMHVIESKTVNKECYTSLQEEEEEITGYPL